MLDRSSLSSLRLDVRFLGSDCDVLVDLAPPDAMVIQLQPLTKKKQQQNIQIQGYEETLNIWHRVVRFRESSP